MASTSSRASSSQSKAKKVKMKSATKCDRELPILNVPRVPRDSPSVQRKVSKPDLPQFEIKGNKVVRCKYPTTTFSVSIVKIFKTSDMVSALSLASTPLVGVLPVTSHGSTGHVVQVYHKADAARMVRHIPTKHVGLMEVHKTDLDSLVPFGSTPPPSKTDGQVEDTGTDKSEGYEEFPAVEDTESTVSATKLNVHDSNSCTDKFCMENPPKGMCHPGQKIKKAEVHKLRFSCGQSNDDANMGNAEILIDERFISELASIRSGNVRLSNSGSSQNSIIEIDLTGTEPVIVEYKSSTAIRTSAEHPSGSNVKTETGSHYQGIVDGLLSNWLSTHTKEQSPTTRDASSSNPISPPSQESITQGTKSTPSVSGYYDEFLGVIRAMRPYIGPASGGCKAAASILNAKAQPKKVTKYGRMYKERQQQLPVAKEVMSVLRSPTQQLHLLPHAMPPPPLNTPRKPPNPIDDVSIE